MQRKVQYGKAEAEGECRKTNFGSEPVGLASRTLPTSHQTSSQYKHVCYTVLHIEHHPYPDLAFVTKNYEGRKMFLPHSKSRLNTQTYVAGMCRIPAAWGVQPVVSGLPRDPWMLQLDETELLDLTAGWLLEKLRL